VLALAGTSGDFTRRTFDPWGNPLTRDAAGNLRASTLSERRADYDALPLAWASQEVDPDTGLTHYHFREYSPSLGGWLTQDPIGLAGGYLNLRSYLGNRPADALDKEGRFIWGFVIGAAADFIVQTVVEGRSLSDVNYYRVSASAVIGLATGGASALVSRGASAAGASLAGRIAGQAMVGAAASVTQNAVVNIDHGRPLAENAGKAAIAGALIAGAMEPLMEGAGAITDAVTEAYSEARIGISLIRESSKSGGANAVAAEVSVAENTAARTAVQAEASPSVQVRLTCPKAAREVVGAADDVAIQFGKNANQVQHAFRHTDALGLNRAVVQSGVQSHLKTVASQIAPGKPFNQIIEVGGQRIQYTAFKLPDGTINVGRIHGAP
jgi:RHS repeat-associated protein